MFDLKSYTPNQRYWYRSTTKGEVRAYGIWSYSSQQVKELIYKNAPVERSSTQTVLEIGFKTQQGEVVRWKVKPERLIPLSKDEMAILGYTWSKEMGYQFDEGLFESNKEAKVALLAAKQALKPAAPAVHEDAEF